MSVFEGLKSVANIHPLLVHFSISLLLVATLLFAVSSLMKSDNELIVAAKWSLILGSLFAVATVMSGLAAGNSVPHNEDIHNAMKIHRNIMIPVTLLSLILAGYIYIQKDLRKIEKFTLFLTGLVLMSALLVLGADFGGKMVFKYGAGTELFRKMYPEAGEKHEHNKGGHHHSEGEEHHGGAEERGPDGQDEHGHGEEHGHVH